VNARRLLQVLALGATAVVVGTSRARADDPSGWNTAAAELTRQGVQHASEGNEALATRRFAEAAALDPSYGPAYLELGRARERAGDLSEALRVYDVAVSHVPRFTAGYRARAAVERRLGLVERELDSLQAASRLSDDPDVLRDIAARYVENHAWPAALATWRRVLVLEESAGEARPAREATLHVRALALLCGELDPVTAGQRGRGWVRSAEAKIALGRRLP